MPIEELAKTYKDIEQEYDTLFKTTIIRDEQRAYRWIARQVLRAKPDFKSLLDVACGGGYFLKEVGDICPNAFLAGMDISSQALMLAREQCPEISFFQSVAERLPFSDHFFDVLTCLGSLEHFLDVSQAIQEMKRIVRPGGLILILVPNIFWYKDILSVLFTGGRKSRNQTHERFASLGEWVELFEKLGLKITKIQKYNGIARRPAKQWLKDVLIPTRFSYHFLFYCQAA